MARKDFHLRKWWRFQEDRKASIAACQNAEGLRQSRDIAKLSAQLKDAIPPRSSGILETPTPYCAELTDNFGNSFLLPILPSLLPTMWELLDLAGWPDGEGQAILDQGEIIVLGLTGRMKQILLMRSPWQGGVRSGHYVQIDYPEKKGLL